MHQPDIHLDYVRSRHGDLLRRARTGELAARLAEARRQERRSFLARLTRERQPCQPSTSTSSAVS